jgi:predicted component of type VI protein secretion system
MSAKSEKLAQKIQDVKKFVLAKENRYLNFSAIATELEGFLACLQTQKLNLKIISRYPILAGSVQNLIDRNPQIKDIYNCQTATLAGIQLETATKSPTSLLLKANADLKIPKTRYLLSIDRKMAIGRSPDCQIQLPIDCTTVSRYHAQIRSFLNSGADRPTINWVIYDLNSANGTYVNDISLQGNSQILKHGDRIILGKYRDTTGPELVFEDLSTPAISPEDELKKLLNGGDILCLVINPNQALLREEKALISLAREAKFIKIIAIADTSTISQNQEIIQTNLAQLKVWQNSADLNDILTLQSLPLKSFYREEQSGITDAETQRYVDAFIDLIQQSQAEDVIKDRVKSQFISQLSVIDTVFDGKLADLKEELAQHQKSLGGKTLEEINEQLKKVVKQVNRHLRNIIIL